MKKLFAVILALALLCAAAVSLAETWTCTECGNDSEGNFCSWCGAKKPAPVVTCPSCGAEFDAGAGFAFCNNCGASLSQPVDPAGPADPAGSPAAVEVGSIVTFGIYEQDGDDEDGLEPIEWIVMDVQDGKALLLSRYCLDVIPYHTEDTDVTWETCSLRGWLNGEFMGIAFCDADLGAILLSDVDNSEAQQTGEFSDVTGGNDTQDYVFLLSYYEAYEVYFTSDAARMCPLTDYAVSRGAWTSDDDRIDGRYAGSWYLRSPGCLQEDVLSVFSDGDLDDVGVHGSSEVVRPALWVDLNEVFF